MLNEKISESLTIKSKLCRLREIREKLTQDRLDLFRATCFGALLDSEDFNNDPALVLTILKMEIYPPGGQPMDSLYYRFHGHTLRYGPEEFCLMSGLIFGPMSVFPGPRPQGFVHRVFGNQKLTICRLKALFDTFSNQVGGDRYSDIDVVRVCLMMMVEEFFLGRQHHLPISATVLALIENLGAWNRYPWGSFIWDYTYTQMKGFIERRREKKSKLTLTGFIQPFKIWILETFPRSSKYFVQHNRVPRISGWARKRKVLYTPEIMDILLVSAREQNQPLTRLVPTTQEEGMASYRSSQMFFRGEAGGDPDKDGDDNDDEDGDDDEDEAVNDQEHDTSGIPGFTTGHHQGFRASPRPVRFSDLPSWEFPSDDPNWAHVGLIQQAGLWLETRFDGFQARFNRCPSRWGSSPYTQCPDTTPVRPRPTGTSRLQVQDTSCSATATPYVEQLYLQNQLPGSMRIPYLPNLTVEPTFWGQLLGYVSHGWLEDPHIEAWVRMALTSRSPASGWTVVVPEWWGRLLLGNIVEVVTQIDGSMTSTDGFPSWTESVNIVLIPMNIDNIHWVLGEFSLRTMELIVYDSYQVETVSPRIPELIQKFRKNMKFVFMCLGDPEHARRLNDFRWSYAEDVPQQTGQLGDCGAFTCRFLTDRINGQQPNMHIDIRAWRREMANLFWASTSN